MLVDILRELLGTLGACVETLVDEMALELDDDPDSGKIDVDNDVDNEAGVREMLEDVGHGPGTRGGKRLVLT